MRETLLDFYTSSRKRKPDQIIIFRDGVSESQFNQVLIKLLRLLSSLTRSGTLKIMVIILRKTIILSFFSKDLLTMCYMVLLLTIKHAIQRTMFRALCVLHMAADDKKRREWPIGNWAKWTIYVPSRCG